MFEKVNPMHPDKIADRIAGAIVDHAYTLERDPKIAVEVLIGHGNCHIIAESSCTIDPGVVAATVQRIAGDVKTNFVCVKQDAHLANNQKGVIRCGDNGIFKGMPVTAEQNVLASIAHMIYSKFPTDGKYILDDEKLIICQSHATNEELRKHHPDAIINPLGYWTGGPDVDTGATNRKLGSDMGDAVTGGGLHGKDLSKADVSVNIYAYLRAQELGEPVSFSCAIGDERIDGRPYRQIVEIARSFIKAAGGFEAFAEWGLI